MHRMRLQWHLAALLIYALVTANNIPSVGTFLFRQKHIHHLVNDPYQVKKDNITRDNLFAWLNMKNHIKFKLWTRKNPRWAHEIRIGDVDSLRTSNFDLRRLTKVLVHGYAHSATEVYLEDWLVSLREAFLHMADLNILIIDYTLFALPMFYWSAAPDLAAEQLTEMIKFLVENGVMLESLHMLGFSWGAHVAGIAGGMLGGKIGRITGLDPAQPTFRLVEDSKRLDKSDAMYVDIIHTNGGRAFMEGHLGLGNALGHADYYPNSGRAQPGCPTKWTHIYEEIECDHARSVAFFAESIVSPVAFPACRCDSWDNYVKGQCPCGPEDRVFMGEHSPHSTRGKFYLFTRDKKPYGLGTPLYISLPDIDKYDPDWNNTGYHYHVLPHVKKESSHKTQNHNNPYYKDNTVVKSVPQFYQETVVTQSPVQYETHYEPPPPPPEVYWEHQGSVVIPATPFKEYSYVENSVSKRDSPSTPSPPPSLSEETVTAQESKGSSTKYNKITLKPKDSSRSVVSFTRQLFDKYISELSKSSQLNISL